MNLIQRLRVKLIDRQGSGEYIAVLVGLLILLSVVALAWESYGVYMTKKDCEEVAGEIARYIELKGAYDSVARSEFERLCNVAKLDATLEVTKNGKIQLEDEFTVTVSASEHLFNFQVPLKGKATGRSEVYHK